MNSRCNLAICLLRGVICVKRAGHWLQAYGFSPVWSRWCWVRCCFVLNLLLQNGQENGRNCASAAREATWGLRAGTHCRGARANPRIGASPGCWCLDNPGHPLDPCKEKQSALVQPTAPAGGPHGSTLEEEQV